MFCRQISSTHIHSQRDQAKKRHVYEDSLTGLSESELSETDENREPRISS